MAKKKVGVKNKSKDEGDKDKSNSDRSGRILRPRNVAEGERNADEKAKGRALTVKTGNLTICDGAEKGETSEVARTPAKRNRNSSANEKGKSILRSSDRVLRSHGGSIGKRKYVTEEESSEKSKTKRRNVDKESNRNAGGNDKGKGILISSERSRILDEKAKGKGKLVAEEGNKAKPRVESSYNLRARKAVLSFQRVGLSESGFLQVVGKRVKVFRSGLRRWVTGNIESYDDKKELHKVLYDDGELEELNLKTRRFEVEAMPDEASTLSSRHERNTGKKPMQSVGASVDAMRKNTKRGKETTSTVQKKNPARKGQSNAGTKK
ncbi:sister chromatid cohesion protein PDS5 homolog C-like [Actinidia eriantha]|uniref:sister chromatid cohesion protein PDS5 homolog C-like n=1 Tax=Actinidia eriantha TaxID=165200 RepID=UPI00258892EA|nr:sister chromatid cohesion protein PDS5 homolog C-like [Actinidia eriantha]XP_057502769.1 sister chromatid cohesion protein PDS5 homolog C-like [Actinidia eriantha]